MELIRFSLGLRFVVDERELQNAEQVWQLLFNRVPWESIKGLSVFGAQDTSAAGEPEAAYICVFSGLSLSRAKALYEELLSDTYLCSFLTAYMPFVQHNHIEKCKPLTYLGVVSEDGVVSNGEAGYGAMRFSQPEAHQIKPSHGRIVIAAESLGLALPSARVGRKLFRLAGMTYPYAVIRMGQIADGGLGTLEALVSGTCGRFLSVDVKSCEGLTYSVPFGVLPDRTAVLETLRIPDTLLMDTMDTIAQLGYKTFILAGGGCNLPHSYPAPYTVTILDDHPHHLAGEQENVFYRSGVETVLESGGVLGMIKDASLVITAIRLSDGHCSLQGAVGDSILYHCRTGGIPAAVLFFRHDGVYLSKMPDGSPEQLPAYSFDEAATLFIKKLSAWRTIII